MKAITLISLFAGALLVQQGAMATGIELNMVVQKEIKLTSPQGKKRTKLVEPQQIIPGDSVVYTTHFHNTGAQQANNVLIVSPVPKHLTYVGGSARGPQAEVTYSVDGGKHYAPSSQLRVKDKNGKLRPATAKDYTHIRWLLARVDGGQKGSVRFKATVDEE